MPLDPLVFPHLDGGALAQLPVRLTIERQIPRLRFPDGSEVRDSQNCALRYSWLLAYENLNATEWQRFRTFINEASMGARTFSFPDPLGNLLLQSRDLTASPWPPSAGLTVAPFADPLQPEAFILTNSSPAPLTLTQAVPLGGAFTSCFSLRAMWTSAAGLSLSLDTAAVTTTRSFTVGDWRTLHVTHTSSTPAASRLVSITVPPTSQVIVAAPQLELAAQPGAYHATGSASALFSQAWLDQPEFISQSLAPGAHSISLRIVSQRPL